MAEDKKDDVGGAARTYLRFFTAFLAAIVIIYARNMFSNPNAPTRN
jgi:hypothetical protein